MATRTPKLDAHESDLHFAGMTREFIAAGADGVRPVIETGLERICRWSGSDAARIDVLPEGPGEPGWMAISSEHAPSGTLVDLVTRLLDPRAPHAWFRGRLAEAEPLAVAGPADLPPEAEAERALVAAAEPGSLLFIPVVIDGHVFGCLTLESRRAGIDWPRNLVGRLRTMAEVYTSVASRELTDRARRRAERRFDALAQFSHHIVCEFDGDGAMTFVSPSVRDVLGIAPEAGLGRGFLDFVHPEDRDDALDALRLDPDLTVDEFTVRLRRSDGQYRWMEVEASSFPGTEGPRRVVAVLRDVTDRHERQTELKEHLAVEREVTRLSKEFVGLESASLAEAFRSALEASTSIAGCDRSYVIGVMEDLNAGVPEIHSWSKPGLWARPTDADPKFIAKYQWLRSHVLQGKPVIVPDVRDLPDEAALEREELIDRRVGSYLALPLRDGDRTIGVLAFSTHERRARWGDHQLTMLRLVAELFGAVFRRARTEAHLREREERFRVLADQSPDPIIELDDRGRILFASVDFAALLGDPDEDWVGRSLVDFVAPDEVRRINAIARESSDGRRVPPTVFQCRHSDGTTRYLEATVRSFVSVRGARHGIATLRDVTARLEDERTLEQQLTLERQIVQISSDFMGRDADELEDAVKRSMGIVAHLARADRCAVVSFGATPGARHEVYEWAAEGLGEMGQSPIDLDPHSRPMLSRLLFRGERFAVSRISSMPSSFAAERADLERHGIRSFLVIPFMNRRRLAGVFALGTVRREVDWNSEDLTILSLASDIFHGALRRRQVALELEQSQRQLLQSQKMEAVGTLAGGIAHDFNNQLAVMLGNVRYVMERQTELTESHEALKDLERAAEHCAQLTRSLLAFSRQGAQERRTLSVATWLDEVGELVKPLLPATIDLDIRVERDTGAVHGDETQLQQVIVNLLVNARDAMPDGGRIRLGASRKRVSSTLSSRLSLSSRDVVELVIRDDGMGMSADVRERIFEPFFTTKDLGQGTGLGLATVYGIVQQCGGGVEVESAPGRGATFRVYLPAFDATGDAAPAAAGAPPAVSRSFDTILLVEDEPAVRRVVKRMLETRAKEVIEARNGDEALERVAGRLAEIDLLVTDMVMPRMGGLALARRIAETRSDLPTLFLSGYPNDELDFEREPLEHHRFLQKPFTERDLAAALDSLLKSPL